MKNEQEIVRSVFDAYIRDAKANSTKKDRPTFDMLEEVKNMAIKALEQQPSDDCVSRQAVLDLMQLKMGGKELYKAVYELPPVTPTRKVGKWKSDGHGHIVCTACNKVNVSLWKSKYCPCCGAEMRGSENDSIT